MQADTRSRRPTAPLPTLQPNHRVCFCTVLQTYVRAAASLVIVMAVDRAKHGARGGKRLLATGLSMSPIPALVRDHVLRPHARIFASTHLKTRRITRPGSVILRTAASRRLSSRALPPTCPIGRSLRPLAGTKLLPFCGVVWSTRTAWYKWGRFTGNIE